MKNFKEFINETKALKIKSHKTVDEIAKKHRLDISFIQNQLEMGIPIEHEHTRDKVLATDIALQHLNEIPDYYTRLKKMEASAKKEHKKFKDVKETVTIEDANGNTFLEIVDLIKAMDNIEKVKVKQLDGFWFDCGTHDDLHECSALVRAIEQRTNTTVGLYE